MADPAATWLAFLASPGAPKTALSPLELDGYLTGIIVSPQPAPIMPSRWLGGLWGEDEPVFEDEKQINLILGAVMGHYNALIKEIDRSLKRLEAGHACDYRPMFLTDNSKPPRDAVRGWVRGFWKAMALAPEAWGALADGKTTVCRPYAFRWERRRNKVMASQAALLMLWRYLSGELRDDG